jgi:hypothetical protein
MSTTTTTTTKTLPMKFKAMHYALLAFINQSDELAADVKVSLITKLPVFDTIENQVLFYEKMVDFKIVEKEIVKPMIKKALTDVKVNVKKPRAAKKPKDISTATTMPAVTNVVTTDVVSAAVTTVVSAAVVTTEVPVPVSVKKQKKTKNIIVPATTLVPPESELKLHLPVLNNVITDVPVVKKKRVVKKIVPSKKATAELEDNEVVEEMLLTDEMKEEPYRAQKLEKTVLKRSLNKVVDIEVDHWLIFREGVRYWTTDESEQNGMVYDYDQDQDGDGAPGAIVGKLENGKLILN